MFTNFSLQIKSAFFKLKAMLFYTKNELLPQSEIKSKITCMSLENALNSTFSKIEEVSFFNIGKLHNLSFSKENDARYLIEIWLKDDLLERLSLELTFNPDLFVQSLSVQCVELKESKLGERLLAATVESKIKILIKKLFFNIDKTLKNCSFELSNLSITAINTAYAVRDVLLAASLKETGIFPSFKVEQIVSRTSGVERQWAVVCSAPRPYFQVSFLVLSTYTDSKITTSLFARDALANYVKVSDMEVMPLCFTDEPAVIKYLNNLFNP